MIVVIIAMIHLAWDILFQDLRDVLPAPEVRAEPMLFEFGNLGMGFA